MDIEELLNLLPKEKIRRIQIGTNGEVGYQVGKDAIKDRCKVAAIILNVNMSIAFHTKQYDIYVEDEGEVKLLESFSNVPFRVTYEL